MMRARWMLAAIAAAFAPAFAQAGVSETIDALWDFDKPSVSETRFRAERVKWPAGSREALETGTQVARAQGLQRQFADAHATLDAIEPSLAATEPRVRVRYLLERGRVFNSSGVPGKAVPLFQDALRVSGEDAEAGAAYYRIDALHMLGIAAPAPERLTWNLQALATAERATDPRARGWRASLQHNLGWTYFDNGNAATALAYWQRALAAREEAGDPARIRFARWTVARGLRAVGRLDDAERIQRALAAELERAGAVDGYVYEELAEIAMARGDPAAAAPWAARAYAELTKDPGLVATAPARLARLKELGAKPAP